MTGFGWTADDGWAGSGTATDPYALAFPSYSGISSPDRVNLGNTLNLGTSFTLEAEFRFSQNRSIPQYIIAKQKRTPPYQGYCLYLDAGTGELCLQAIQDYGAGSWVQYDSSMALDDDAWHHVVVTYDGASSPAVKLYIDGSLDSAATCAAGSDGAWDPSTNNDYDAEIGGRGANCGYGEVFGPCGGSIALARIYDRALSASDAAQNCSADGTTGMATAGLLLNLNAQAASAGGPGANNAGGTTVWKDLVTGGPDLSLANYGWNAASGWAGSGSATDPYCLKSDGASSAATSDSALFNLGSGPRTVSVWTKLNDYRGANENIIGDMAASSPYTGWGLFFDGNRDVQGYVIEDYSASHYVGWVTSAPLAVGSWHNVALVYDGNACSIYVDGAPASGTLLGSDGAWDADVSGRPFSIAGSPPVPAARGTSRWPQPRSTTVP